MAAYASGPETYQALAFGQRAGHGVGQEEAEDAAMARPACVGLVQHSVGAADDPRRVVRTCREVAVVGEGLQEDLPLGSRGQGLEDAARSFARQDVVVAAVGEVFVAVACFGRGC